MVMCAEILAIGPFTPALVAHYEYPAERYSKTHEGVPIVSRLFGIMEGTSAGIEFARALGIADPLDFNQHKIQLEKIDFESLEQVLSTLSGWHDDDYAKHLAALKQFAAHKYDLYFIPNA